MRRSVVTGRCGALLAMAAGMLLHADITAAVLEVGPQADLQAVLAAAAPGDTVQLLPGVYEGQFIIDRSLTLQGPEDRSAVLQGPGKGRTLSVQVPDVTLRHLTVRGSGMGLFEMDAGIFLDRGAHRAVVEENDVLGNLISIYVWGPEAVMVRNNRIVGDRTLRMSERGNGIQLWNSPDTQVIGNDIQYGRDGIYTNTSKRNVFRGNRFEHLRFGVHYMYTQDSEMSDNISLNNEIGYALMMSDRLLIRNNVAEGSKEHGLALNSINSSKIEGNRIKGGGKCAFLYNSNINEVRDNWFEGCAIGLHFTAGAERNQMSGNAFMNNQLQVKYVGTRYLEWSVEGRGNYWSDNTAFDLDGDGIADAAYRPNGILDQVLWRAPMAKVLLNSPATQVVRWAQSQFPALYPGGVVDSAPLMAPPVMPGNPLEEQK